MTVGVKVKRGGGRHKDRYRKIIASLKPCFGARLYRDVELPQQSREIIEALHADPLPIPRRTYTAEAYGGRYGELSTTVLLT